MLQYDVCNDLSNCIMTRGSIDLKEDYNIANNGHISNFIAGNRQIYITLFLTMDEFFFSSWRRWHFLSITETDGAVVKCL